MPEGVLAPISANPHRPTVFYFETQARSNSGSKEALSLALELKHRPYKACNQAIGKQDSNDITTQFSLTDPFHPRLKQNDILLASFLSRIPPYKLEKYIREHVLPKELLDALDELKNSSIEALEDGYEAPSNLALHNAERMLREMYDISPQRFEVYPTPDAEIAIRALAPRKSVIVLCESSGGALCLVNVNSGRRRKRFETAGTLSDSFIMEALLDLKGESI